MAEGETPTRLRLRELLSNIEAGRASIAALRDEARDHLGMPFKVRDMHVMMLHRLLDAYRDLAAVHNSEASDTVAAAPQPKTCANAIDRLEQWSAETRGSWRLTRVTNEAHALAPLGVGFGLELMTVDGTRVFEKSGKGRPLETAVAAAFKKVGYALPESKGHAPRRTEP